MATAHSTSLRRWLLSLPPVEYALQHIRELLIGSLRCGPIPQHIAFIMDGNRRWARTHHVETVEGHNMGFEALAKILEVCYKSGVKHVTIYAFSIENFKRSKYEVDGLMDMAKTKLVQMSQHGELFDRYGAAVRIVGDRSLVRDDVLETIDKAVEMTKYNTQAVLNVCFSYTGREEIVHSIREIVTEFSSPPVERRAKRPFSESHIQRNIQKGNHLLERVAEEDQEAFTEPDIDTRPGRDDGVSLTSDAETNSISSHDLDSSQHINPPSSQTSHSPSPVLHATPVTSKRASRAQAALLDPETISQDTITKHTYIDAPSPDIVIRTSGVNRLSDFMIWQVHEATEVKFLDCLWPELDLWKFLPVLVEWQWSQRKRGEAAGNGTSEIKAA